MDNMVQPRDLLTPYQMAALVRSDVSGLYVWWVGDGVSVRPKPLSSGTCGLLHNFLMRSLRSRNGVCMSVEDILRQIQKYTYQYHDAALRRQMFLTFEALAAYAENLDTATEAIPTKPKRKLVI